MKNLLKNEYKINYSYKYIYISFLTINILFIYFLLQKKCFSNFLILLLHYYFHYFHLYLY